MYRNRRKSRQNVKRDPPLAKVENFEVFRAFPVGIPCVHEQVKLIKFEAFWK